MKLLNYTNRKLALFVFLLIGIWGVFFFFALHHEITDETDDMLCSYRDIFIKNALRDPDLLNSSYETTFDRYAIRPISDEEAEHYEELFYDIETYFPDDDEHIPLRVYKSIFRALDQRYYELEISMSTMERKDMLETLLTYLIVLFVLLLLLIVIGNRIILKQSFKPLLKLLDWLNSVVPGKTVPALENKTKIEEFKQLNKAAYAMSLRSLKSYEIQKQFIENASHELQTPLAVALNKTEMLAQNENMSEQELSEIDAIYKALNKAGKINKSLLFLSRIENEQFSEKKEININRLLRELSEDFIEIYADKNIDFQLTEESQLTILLNENLAQTLISNLLKNAFVHTLKNGEINILIGNSTLKIENSGEKALEGERIFERFYRAAESKNENSTGLGLAIVKSIADANNIAIDYQFRDKHVFLLKFMK